MYLQSNSQMFYPSEAVQSLIWNRVTVNNVPLVSAEPDDVCEVLLDPARKTVNFLNAHCANVMAHHDGYAAALGRTDYVLPDGIGIEIAARMEGKRLEANLNGTDFVPFLLQEAAQKKQSVFLIGGKPGTAERAAEKLQSDIPGIKIAGTRNGYDDAERTEEAIWDINLSEADIVLVAMGVPRQELWIDAHRHRIHSKLVMGVGGLFDFLAGNVKRAPKFVRQMKLEWAWRMAQEPRRLAKRYLVGNVAFVARSAAHAFTTIDWKAARKRTMDVATSSMLLAGLAIPMTILAVLLKLDSPGPVLFRQTRVGKDGKPFEILKFRSMYRDAEQRRAALLATSDREGVCFKSKNDPRITRVGRFMRRFSLDELPQLLNVLRGDMSMVGPRPALPNEVIAFPKAALGRLSVKPGLTGLWQVSGRASIGFDKMIDMDLAYAKSRSSLMDLVIMCTTFRAVVSGRGAY